MSAYTFAVYISIDTKMMLSNLPLCRSRYLIRHGCAVPPRTMLAASRPKRGRLGVSPQCRLTAVDPGHPLKLRRTELPEWVMVGIPFSTEGRPFRGPTAENYEISSQTQKRSARNPSRAFVILIASHGQTRIARRKHEDKGALNHERQTMA